MKRWAYSISLLFILVLTACGTTDDNAVDSSEPEELSEDNLEAVLENLDLEVSADQIENSIEFKFELVNKNEDTIDFMFSSGQQFEVELVKDEELVYRYSEDKMFTQALVEESLKSGEAKIWSETWEPEESLEAGEYEVTMTLLPTEINEHPVEGEPLQQTITLQVETIEENSNEDESDTDSTTNDQNTNDETSTNDDNDTSQSNNEENNDLDEPFRNVTVEGENGNYIVSGELDTSIGNVYYDVEDGHNYLVERTEVSVEGEGWQPFEINVNIAEELLPSNGAVILLLYTEDRVEQLPVQLELRP